MTKMQVTSLSSKGQVVIPNDIRSLLGIKTGAKLLIVTDGDSMVLKPIQTPKFEIFKDLIERSRKFAKEKNLKRSDVQKIIRQVRNENRS